MPAPQPSSNEQFLTQQLISAGFVKRVVDPATNNFVPATPAELPDALKKMVQAHSRAINLIFADWMARQTVTIPSTSTVGSPSVGTPPAGGLTP